MTEIKSAKEVNYIAETYDQNDENAAAIDTLQGIVPSIRTAFAFNFSLAIAMLLGFMLTWFSNGKDIRGSVFEKIH
jgi:hypothetical protein